MDLRAALLTLTLAVATGLLLYLPFLLWLRRRGARSRRGLFRPIHFTAAGLVLVVGMLLVMFGGFSMGVSSPDSWLGSQVRTVFAFVGYATTVTVAGSIVERALVKRGVRFWRRDDQ